MRSATATLPALGAILGPWLFCVFLRFGENGLPFPWQCWKNDTVLWSLFFADNFGLSVESARQWLCAGYRYTCFCPGRVCVFVLHTRTPFVWTCLWVCAGILDTQHLTIYTAARRLTTFAV